MYTTSYKLNNSYTTYVIHDNVYNYNKYYEYKEPPKTLEWKCGAKVNHYLYGEGIITSIKAKKVFVKFCDSKAPKALRNIQVMFEFKKTPREINSLKLCF